MEGFEFNELVLYMYNKGVIRSKAERAIFYIELKKKDDAVRHMEKGLGRLYKFRVELYVSIISYKEGKGDLVAALVDEERGDICY